MSGNQETAEIVVVLDRSGSMASVKKDMERGFDHFIEEQRKLPGSCAVTLIQFDTNGTDIVYEEKPLADVPGLVLEPRGWTPLLDAVGRAITRTIERLDKIVESLRPSKLLFMVITDGEENSSTEFKREQVKQLVDDQTKAGWAFSFLGANLDAFAEAGKLGIAMAASANYVPDAAGVQHAFIAMSASAATYRSGGEYTLRNNDPRVAQSPVSGKSPAAIDLGRKGGQVGGKARAAILSPEERSRIASDAAKARWKK